MTKTAAPTLVLFQERPPNILRPREGTQYEYRYVHNTTKVEDGKCWTLCLNVTVSHTTTGLRGVKVSVLPLWQDPRGNEQLMIYDTGVMKSEYRPIAERPRRKDLFTAQVAAFFEERGIEEIAEMWFIGNQDARVQFAELVKQAQAHFKEVV